MTQVNTSTSRHYENAPIYRGSDAEYIISNRDGSRLSQTTYVEVALTQLEFQFPRNRVTDAILSAERITELNRNEPECIEKLLSEQNLTSQPIPKTLYDLFYVAFRIEQLAKSLKKGKEEGIEDLKRIKDEIYDCIAEQTEDLEAQAKGEAPQEKPHLSKLDFEINEYISGYLKQEGVQDRRLNRENITTLFNALWPTVSMQDMEKELEEKFERLTKGLSPFEKRKYCDGLSILCVSKILKGNRQNFRKLYELAIDLEFSQDPSYYTLYRLIETFGQQNTESTADKAPNITALGNSLLSGAEGKNIYSLKLSHPIHDYSQTVYRIPVLKEGIDYPNKKPDFLQLIPSKRSARFMKSDLSRSTFSRLKVSSMKEEDSTKEPLNPHLKALNHFFGSENMIPFFKLGPLSEESTQKSP